MKIAMYKTSFADIAPTKKAKRWVPVRRFPGRYWLTGIELFEDDGYYGGGKRWAILSNDLPEETVQEIVGILTKLPQRSETAGKANAPQASQSINNQ